MKEVSHQKDKYHMVSLTGDSQGSQNHRHKTEGQSPRARGEGNAELECNGDSFHFERKVLEIMVRQCLMSLNCEINQNGSGENQGVGNTTLWERVGGRCDEGQQAASQGTSFSPLT